MNKINFRYQKGVAVVETKQGRIRGYEYNGLNIFKGIPYGTAKRFHQAVSPDAWEGELNCTNFGYVCPLLMKEKPAVELCVPHRYWMMDEDCLNLNLWTPGLDDKKRPVLVWLHGGGYESGSAIEHLAYEGENMARFGDVVVISINHRLNVLGYMDLSAFGEEYENSGNNGMMDIILALKWVRDNISLFGGDPSNVTLFGQSGGGGKIITLMQMPEADGLFHKVIIMSGVCNNILPDQVESGEEFVTAMMEDLGLHSIKELEEVSYEALAKTYLKLRPAFDLKGKNTGSKPYRNKHYKGDVFEVDMREETEDIPLMIGSVFGEFAAFSPAIVDKNTMSKAENREFIKDYLMKAGECEEDISKLLSLFEKAYPNRSFIDLLQYDFVFREPVIRYTRLRATKNSCTYSYMFDQDTLLEDGRVPWHCADVPYFFHNTEMAAYSLNENVKELENAIFEAAMAFARTGNPNHKAIPAWKPVTVEEEPVLFFADHMRIQNNPDHELVLLAQKMLGNHLSKVMDEGNIAH